jgi:hypothetical protein
MRVAGKVHMYDVSICEIWSSGLYCVPGAGQ